MVFFDIETTIPRRRGEGYSMLEFGAVVVDGTALLEKRTYSTLIRPLNLKSISHRSVECNHITKRMAERAPSFDDGTAAGTSRRTRTRTRLGSMLAHPRSLLVALVAVRSPVPACAVAEKIFWTLDGKVWCGHNIKQFDIPRLNEHFAAAGRPCPSPAGVIDTLPLLRRTFGTR